MFPAALLRTRLEYIGRFVLLADESALCQHAHCSRYNQEESMERLGLLCEDVSTHG
jgi:hypothetical protein